MTRLSTIASADRRSVISAPQSELVARIPHVAEMEDVIQSRPVGRRPERSGAPQRFHDRGGLLRRAAYDCAYVAYSRSPCPPATSDGAPRMTTTFVEAKTRAYARASTPWPRHRRSIPSPGSSFTATRARSLGGSPDRDRSPHRVHRARRAGAGGHRGARAGDPHHRDGVGRELRRGQPPRGPHRAARPVSRADAGPRRGGGQGVLIVDDLTDTGRTARSCAPCCRARISPRSTPSLPAAR